MRTFLLTFRRPLTVRPVCRLIVPPSAEGYRKVECPRNVANPQPPDPPAGLDNATTDVVVFPN